MANGNVEWALTWFLNGLNELGAESDPVEDLATVIEDESLARHLMECFQKMTPAERVRFQMPSVGDRFQRQLISKWVDSFQSQA